ncbi:MAG: response regulator transcription factor [Chloroflexi bacterium]|nr:response regulator transcription factor [Chloroflexota bacterium]
MSESIRILIVDDHAIVRTGLSALIEAESDLELVGQAANGFEAIEEFNKIKPDVVLMDLIMPKMGGIEAIQKIRDDDPDASILVLSSFSEENKVIPAIKAGALGYILKDSSPEELVKAIHDVNQGKPSLHNSIARILMQDVAQGKDEQILVDPITNREIDVLVLVAQGFSNKEVADKLVISEATVRFHVSNILAKLNLENRTQAALYAIKEGLIST